MFEVLLVALKLGVTSFGGPVAHIGYFRDEYVTRRRWLDERSYADLVALCQLLPGPASSQVGIAVGMTRAGIGGGVAAWLGFTLPSAALLILFGYGVASFEPLVTSGLLRGLKVVAAAVVAFAVYGMAQSLAPDRRRATIAVLAAIGMLFWRTPLAQVLVIAVAGGAGWVLLRDTVRASGAAPRNASAGVFRSVVCLALFLLLLAGLPLARQLTDSAWLGVFDAFYRSGALVFGGGHVVLPLLQAEVVPAGWVSGDRFIAGYGAAQAVPGPLFTFSAYLGTVMAGPHGWLARWPVRPRGDLPALVSAGDRHPAAVGSAALGRALPRRGRGGQRGGRRSAARRAVRPGMDHGDARSGRRGPGPGRVRHAGLVEAAAVAGGAARRGGRRRARRAVASEPGNPVAITVPAANPAGATPPPPASRYS